MISNKKIESVAKPLLTILLLLPLSVSAGELDGKAVMCSSVGTSVDFAPLPIEFRGGQVVEHEIGLDGTRAVIKETFRLGKYNVRPDTIMFGGQFFLDRKTLVMQWRGGNVYEWQCKLSPSLAAFRQSVEALRRQHQEKINRKMRDNKI